LIIGVLVSLILTTPVISFADQYKVTRVTDGDTINVVGNGHKEIIRLVGIDAPETSKKKHEPGQPFSQKSTKYLASLVLNKSVDVKSYGTGRYGRTLAVVFVNGKNVNLEMIKAGLAEVYRGPPAKGLDLEPYWKAEKAAREAGRGMWSLGEKYVSPREWRRGKRK
jgi:endonuclease YncB( thermonuclease family)